MKYDEMKVSTSYNYATDNVSRGKVAKKRKHNPLDIAIVASVSGVIISGTVLISRLMTSGVIDSIFTAIR